MEKDQKSGRKENLWDLYSVGIEQNVCVFVNGSPVGVGPAEDRFDGCPVRGTHDAIHDERGEAVDERH